MSDDFLRRASAYDLRILDYRTQWKHATKRWKQRALGDIKGVVFHQTGGGDSISGLGKYHTGPNHISQDGLPGIAYTLFVNKPGDVFMVNELADITWSHGDASQPGDENKMYLGVCFGGKFKPWPGAEKDPTPAQVQRARSLWTYLRDYFGLCGLDLYGHFDFGKDACPGEALQRYILETRASVKLNSDVDGENLATPEGRLAFLAQHGYETEGDSHDDPDEALFQATKAFQRDHDLSLTGVWDARTTAEAYRAIVRGGTGGAGLLGAGSQ